MCFEQLPIEFDINGNATLKEGVRDPYGYQVNQIGDEQDKLKKLLAQNGYVKSVDYDPVTRVAGALAFHSVVDLENREVLSANSMATLFRGYEIILKGRDPLDAIFVSSRACGVCGGVHATVAAEALEMAFDVQPPPLGIVVRNMLLALEYLYDHPLHLFLLAGPDYSQMIVEATNPRLYEQAKQTEARRRDAHGFHRIADIMVAMNPLKGNLYLEALHMTRIAREAYCLLGAKYPHPETIVPGGISATVTLETFNEVYSRLQQFFDYSRKACGIWDDLTEFFYQYDPRYRQIGSRDKNLVDTGVWDDPDSYNTNYDDMSDWGERRWATPGAIMDGKLVTTRLHDINIGIEEFIEHSYYEQWDGMPYPHDPSGNPLSPYHPWNKETIPKPSKQNWKERYSWSTSPRWDRRSFEAGAYVRVWNTAAAKKLPFTRFLESTGDSLRILVPAGKQSETLLEWKIPQDWNAFERNRARAYAIPYSTMVAMDNWMFGLDLLKQNKTEISTAFDLNQKGTQIGAGFWGAGRGFLSHHIVAENGVIKNYQILTPSTINASPRDPMGQPGPYEEAVINTPILEEFDSPDEFRGIDILRTIRSFDPCMPCTTHTMVKDHDHVITREVNTCGCGVS